MSKMTKANILACSLILTQLFLAFIINNFSEEISQFFSVGDMTYALIISNQIFSLFIPTMIFVLLFCRSEKVKITELMRLSPISGKNILLIVGMSLFIQPLMSILSLVSQLAFRNNVGVLAFTLAEEMSYLPVVLSIAVIPAIFEELALRGAILGAYGMELDERRAILINGLFFGMIHLDGQQLLYAIALGAFFSYVVLRTGSIFAGIIAHFTVNATQTTLLFLMLEMLKFYENGEESIAGAAGDVPLPEGMEALAAATTILSVAMMFTIIGVSYVIFFKLLAKFSKLNPSKTEYSSETIETNVIGQDDAEHVPADADAALPEIEGLKTALSSRKRFTNLFYISFVALITIYLAAMSVTDMIQSLFLLGVFAFFFFALFFLRVRS